MEPQFVKAELKEGKAELTDWRGDVWVVRMDFDDVPTIHLIERNRKPIVT